MPRPQLLATVAFTLTALSTGCYAYRPATLSDIRSGDQVDVLLTPAQHEELEASLLGSDRSLIGEVLEVGRDGLLMEVPLVTLESGIRVESLSQRLRIPTEGVADLEIRSLDKTRTYSLIGVATAGVGFLLWEQFGDERTGGTRPPSPPLENRITILRIPFSLPFGLR